MIEAPTEAQCIAKARMWLPEDPNKLKTATVEQLVKNVAIFAAQNLTIKQYGLASMELELAWRLVEKLKEVDR